MIGAGIFALLGEAGRGRGSRGLDLVPDRRRRRGPARLRLREARRAYPSSGGLITYLIEGFGRGRLVGVASWLGYIAAIVIVTAMVAVSFGGYATALFVGEGASNAWDHVFITALLLLMLGLNLVGTKVVAAAQSLIVLGVLAVFAVFICVTVPTIDPSLLAFSGYPPVSKIISSVALTFFAYLGFNVITFTGGDLREPRRNIPRATYLAIGITAVTYVLIAIGVFGTLTVTEVIGYGETAIAEAARPTLGDAGFTMMAIAALLATAGATNATLYASSNLTGMLAEERLFPPFFGSRFPPRREERADHHDRPGARRREPRRPLGDRLGGSAVALMVFLLVGAAGYRRRADTGSNAAIVLLAIAVTAIVLAFFAVDTLRNDPWTFVAIAGIALLSVVLDALVRRSAPAAEAT